MSTKTIISLASVLFKSYLRASRSSRVNIYSNPRMIMILDAVALMIPLALTQIILNVISNDFNPLLELVSQQALIGLPVIITGGVILAGIMFEMSTMSGLSSSEPVNWLPVSAREYVAASAMSMATMYSPILAGGIGVTLPLAFKFGLLNIWTVAIMLSAVALLLGALIIEVLRAVTNSVSSTVYRLSGRLGVVTRLVSLIFLFVVMQLAFNPYILYSSLGILVSSVEMSFFIPMVWPSVAIIRLIKLETFSAILFSALSILFALIVFEAASRLRMRYWLPTHIAVRINSSMDYNPKTNSYSILGFKPLEVAIALKEFRALIRRKDMARFIALPIILFISYLIPALYMPSDYSGRSPGLFLGVFIPLMVPLMFSMISVGQEGEAVVNLCMLPLPARALIKGKLLTAWIISVAATLGAILTFQIVAPMGLTILFSTLVSAGFIILAESFIGLGIGSRYPDYNVGARSRYVTYLGLLRGFLMGGVTTLLIILPTVMHAVSNGGVLGSAPTLDISLPVTLTLTVIIGTTITYFAYRYCKKGVENLLTNLEN